MSRRLTSEPVAMQKIAAFLLDKAPRIVSVDTWQETNRALRMAVDDIHYVSEYISLTFAESWHVNVSLYVSLGVGERKTVKEGQRVTRDLKIEVKWSSFSGNPSEAAAFLSLANEVNELANRLVAFVLSEIGMIGEIIPAEHLKKNL